MTPDEIIQSLERYRFNLVEIMGRFVKGHNSYRIRREDDPSYRTFIIEIIDLLTDAMGDNKYSKMIAAKFQEGTYNQLQTPSYKSIEDIVSIIDSVITRLKRTPDFYTKKEEPTKHEEPIKTELKPTDKVTLKWLWEFVPHSFWIYLVSGLVSALVAAFGFGVKFAETNLYKSLTSPGSPNTNSKIQNVSSSAIKR